MRLHRDEELLDDGDRRTHARGVLAWLMLRCRATWRWRYDTLFHRRRHGWSQAAFPWLVAPRIEHHRDLSPRGGRHRSAASAGPGRDTRGGDINRRAAGRLDAGAPLSGGVRSRPTRDHAPADDWRDGRRL